MTTLLTFCQLLIVGSSSSVVLPWLLSWPQTHVGYDDGIRSVATGVEDERSQKTKHLQCGDRKNIDGWFWLWLLHVSSFHHTVNPSHPWNQTTNMLNSARQKHGMHNNPLGILIKSKNWWPPTPPPLQKKKKKKQEKKSVDRNWIQNTLSWHM